jgi:hypothetical protein
MIYTIYSKTTGQIIKNLSCIEDELNLNYNLLNESYLQDNIDGSEYYIDIVTEQKIKIPPKPNAWFSFDFVTKQWIANEKQAENDILEKRKFLLYQSDWTQLPNGPLTQQQQEAWAVYRQQLRDIPDQSGYPLNVVWPTPP